MKPIIYHLASDLPTPGSTLSWTEPVRCLTRWGRRPFQGWLGVTREPQLVTCKRCRRYARLDDPGQ